MILRPAQAQDAAAIAAIWNAEIRDGVSTFNSVEKTLAEVEDMIATRADAVQVAYADEVFLGFVTFSPFRGGIGYQYCAEHTVYLTPEARGRGVGRALMTRCEDVAHRKGLKVLVAGISGENTAGLEFHAACGFVETGRMPDIAFKFDRWMTLVLMQKKL